MKASISLRALLVAVLSGLLFVGLAGTASAAPPGKG